MNKTRVILEGRGGVFDTVISNSCWKNGDTIIVEQEEVKLE